MPNRGIARRHRLGVGTIVSDASMQVKWLTGGRIGTIEEGFVARLRPGDCFFFAGKLLEFVRVREMAAYVRKAGKKKGTVPTWQGSKMALSTELGDAVLEMMQRAAGGDFSEPELEAARPMLQTQARLSRIPTPHALLMETFRSREGHHLYLYPFAGRHVHLGARPDRGDPGGGQAAGDRGLLDVLREHPLRDGGHRTAQRHRDHRRHPADGRLRDHAAAQRQRWRGRG